MVVRCVACDPCRRAKLACDHQRPAPDAAIGGKMTCAHTEPAHSGKEIRTTEPMSHFRHVWRYLSAEIHL
ncbi:hypothetical protein N7449_000476 [Penicillium cf. viridicatum]|uniref:Zn(2)-C6 fungal-type domain-containing protein n=1 Tax=Penicillium cf. viridicatum TaxID=2972119 RepID=A0A9W9N520_9EURO|nr:hypothetical protein N7449_000476 [Penicillium cf. viridicatum]